MEGGLTLPPEPSHHRHKSSCTAPKTSLKQRCCNVLLPLNVMLAEVMTKPVKSALLDAGSLGNWQLH